MALAKGLHVEGAAGFPRQFKFLDEGLALIVRQEPGDTVGIRPVDRRALLFGIAPAHRVLGEVVGAGKRLAAPDRPGDRRRVQRQLLLDLVEDFERIARLAIHLVDEGDDGDVAQPADLE